MGTRTKEGHVRLVGDTHTRTKIPGYEADQARATAELKHVQLVKSESTPCDVAR